MSVAIKAYRELVLLTKSYLNEEYEKNEWLYSSPENYSYFAQLAKSSPKQVVNHTPIPKVETRAAQAVPIPEPVKPIAPAPLPQPEPASTMSEPALTAAVVPEPNIEEKKAKTEEVVKESRKIELELPKKKEPCNFSQIENFFKEKYPYIPILKDPPDDSAAKPLDQRPILILTFTSDEKERAFLKNLCDAITIRLKPAALVSAYEAEEKKDWQTLFSSSHLQLVICNDYDFYALPDLMQGYREEKNKRFFGKNPVFLLSPIQQYLKQPQLKAALWRSLCEELGS